MKMKVSARCTEIFGFRISVHRTEANISRKPTTLITRIFRDGPEIAWGTDSKKTEISGPEIAFSGASKTMGSKKKNGF